MSGARPLAPELSAPPAVALGDQVGHGDLTLLRAHEPVVRFTRGELFLPCAVDGFVAGSELWAHSPDGERRRLVPRGELTLDRLASVESGPAGTVNYLQFAAEPLSPVEYRRWLRRPDRERFLALGRLARVPLPARIADSLFDLSLLARGRVLGGTAAAAEVLYRALRQADPRNVYYGRVVRTGGWTVLHYLFFYTMNNWRSGFFGINDHETDWEQVFVYLAEGESGALSPRWVAYASHDFRGDDLRRRWDDPQLHKEGTHPVIYAGAGSHASYFEPGEYLMSFEPRFLRPVREAWHGLRRLWIEQLRMGSAGRAGGVASALSIPFVDYARGDGIAVGPGQQEAWTPILISDTVPWVDRYRGLWGMDTRDPLGGERAPSGPKYNRDGSLRQSWYDPLGWAGLDKVTPPAETLPALDARLAGLDAELTDLDRQIETRRETLRRQALDAAALGAAGHLSALQRSTAAQLAVAEQELHALQARRVAAVETRRASAAYRDRIRRGEWDPPQAHLRHAHHPEPPPPRHRLLEVWAALSGALVFLAVGAFVVAPAYWWVSLLTIVIGSALIEAVTRGRITGFLLNSVILLAVLSTGILLWEFWRFALLALLVAVVAYLVRDNLRELTRA